ncbi:hypothetical protein LCGC14_2025640 [marine sediment metagenome]|uniref:Uncharacterized protein n=1 Tax=marine sediment metagenome TaxID=412755 RepID=A0A0F9FIS2_9ZZZZ
MTNKEQALRAPALVQYTLAQAESNLARLRIPRTPTAPGSCRVLFTWAAIVVLCLCLAAWILSTVINRALGR